MVSHGHRHNAGGTDGQASCWQLGGKIFNVRDMVRLAATEVIWARMAGRAALVPMDEASLEAATRTEAIVMDGDVV